MPQDARTRRGPRSRFSLASIISLALWRLRQTGLLMGITTIGMVAAIVIVCAVPLFTNVMNTAGLRSMLLTSPDNPEIEVNTGTVGLSTAVYNEVRQQFDSLVHDSMKNAKPALQAQQSSIISLDFNFVSNPPKEQRSLVMYGVNMDQSASHLGKLHGKLPKLPDSLAGFDVLLSADTAKVLKLKVGDTVPMVMGYYKEAPSYDRNAPNASAWNFNVRVAGIFDGDPKESTYWHDNDFKPFVSTDPKTKVTSITASIVVPNETLLHISDKLSKLNKADSLFADSTGFTIRWYYRLDMTHLSIDDLDTLIVQVGNLQAAYTANYGEIDNGGGFYGQVTFPYLTRTELTSPMFSQVDNPGNLELFRHRVDVSRIPVAVLAIQIILLALFFVSLMTNLLVDRQTDAIALLRSRGASSSQIFGALLTQCIVLSLFAFVIGVPAAIGSVFLLARRTLPLAAQNSLNIVTDHLRDVILTSALYGAGILVIVLLTMSISLLFAARMDVLAIRRQSARSNRRPMWQRLNLDVIAGALALVSYGISLYLTDVGDVLQGDARALIIAPLSVISPFFLIIGCMLLFLRLFPVLLRLASFIVSRGKGAVSMLALAQISRSPRQPIRMTMLLALATAFAIFTLVYTSSENHHIQQITTYMVGADFSGDASTAANRQDVASFSAAYKKIPGVLSASSGYQVKAVGSKAAVPIEFRAVDAATFANTVNWPSQAEQDTGNTLLKKLISLRKTIKVKTIGPIPVIIDSKTANTLLLHVDSVFPMRIDDLNLRELQYQVVGIVPSIPTVNNRITTAVKGTPVPGGVIADYQAFRTIYTHAVTKAKQGDQKNDPFFTIDPPAINHVWLHTRDDATSLASVRTAIKKPDVRLRNVSDRNEMLAELTSDPLYLVLAGVLSIGTITALLLALVGDLLASWLSARSRLTNFAVLRAIGSTPSEVTGVLTWEQVIIYVTGLLLGIAFGALLSMSIIPSLTFTDLNTNVNAAQFYSLQTAFPIQVVVPPTLLLGLLVLGGLFIVALIMMVRVVSQPALSQALRLNED